MDKTLDEVDQSWLQSKINELLDDRRRELEYRRECDLVLENDEALEKWVIKRFPFKPRPPIVRASTYKYIYRTQELQGTWHHPQDDRRPVIMRGARSIRNSGPSYRAVAEEFVKRVFRRYKITWKRATRGEYQEPELWRRICIKLHDKFGFPNRSAEYLKPNYINCHEWINGEFVLIEEKIIKSRPIERQKQYVKQLQNARVIVPPVRLPKREELDKWRAAYDALTELGVKI